MASKLWAYGKRLTLWGALVSSLPLLFFPLIFFSVLGIAFSVPLGCSVAIYICFRKFYCSLIKEEVEVQKGLGVKEIEAREVSDVQERESEEEISRSIHEGSVKPLGEETEKVNGHGGETQAELDPLPISSDEGEQSREGLSLTQSLKCEGEAPLIEKLVLQAETPEEEQIEVKEKSVLHEEVPEDETQNRDATEAQSEEKWEPDEERDTLQWAEQKEQLDPIEEQASEVENHSDEIGEAQLKEKGDTPEEADARQWAAQKEQLDPIEKQATEVENRKDEVGEDQLKEKGDTEEEEEALSTLELEAQKKQLNPIEELAPEVENHKDEVGEAQLKDKGERHALHTLKWEAQKEQLNPVEEQAPEFKTHKDEVGEVQLKENGYIHEEQEPLQGEREVERGEEVKDEEEVSKGAQLKREAQEGEGNDILADPQEEENARQDQPAEVENQTSPKKEVEVEVKVNPFEGEPQSDHSHGRTGENIGTKHKRILEQDESNGKLYATDSKHKIREEEDKEQDESNGVQEILHKRSRHEESLDLAPSPIYTENTSTEANMVTSEATPYSGQQSPVIASNLGVENDEPVEDNATADLPIPPSSEMPVTSASEFDKDSKSLSEGAVKDDTEDVEHMWEEIHALRNIIGYKEDPQLSNAEEIKALYVFTGVEPPASLKYSGALDRAKEKLKLLKLVYGIK